MGFELWKTLKAGVGFFTTIPTNAGSEEFETLSRHIYLFPLFGFIIGALLGGFGYLFQLIFPHPQLIAILLICLLYLITGVNHLDGLADFADGIAAQGIREEKIAVMRDPRLGAGGVLFCTLNILALFSTLWVISQLSALFKLLMIAETSAKLSMVVIIVYGRSTHVGFGSIMIEHSRKRDFIAALFFSAIIAYIALDIHGIAILFSSVLSALLILLIANRNFGGVSGDAIGAANEIGRLAALTSSLMICTRY
ncbi:MAG: adenosylcobinamide-GDP ribazoletransferase [Methanocellales archaeon]